MANLNVRTPKFFVDNINHRLASGTAQNGNADVVDGSINSGKSEAELFDMKPMNQVEFETTAAPASHVLINIDTGGGFNTDFIAILNHNMNDASAQLKVAHSATESHISSIDMAGSTAASSASEVLNVDNTLSSSNVVTSSTNGSTIFTFNATQNRFFGLQFEGRTTNGDAFDTSNDLRVGCILLGETFLMPMAPDLSLRRTIVYDGVNVQESLGGQRYANATHLGRNWISSSNKSPFTLANQSYYVYNGRIVYDLQFSFISSDDLMPSNYAVEQTASDTVVADLWNRVNGNMVPFIMTTDSTSTSESDFLFARMGQNNLPMQQTAPDIFSVQMRIEEEF